jgi:hypothetical protein
MDSRQLDELLQKYWNAETSLEEEQQLREFFAREPVPARLPDGQENLKETASLFRYFEMQKQVGMHDAHFDSELKKKLRKEGKVISISMTQVARIAAGLLVVVAATFFIRQEIKKAYPDEPEDTYTDPKVAFEETKKALRMISKSFNKAQKQASKINILNEATEKIQHPEDPKEEEKKTNI